MQCQAHGLARLGKAVISVIPVPLSVRGPPSPQMLAPAQALGASSGLPH